MNIPKVKCSKCFETKPKQNFYFRAKEGGVMQPCKECKSKKRKGEDENTGDFYNPRAKENIPWYFRR